MSSTENDSQRDNWSDHWLAYSDTASQNPAQDLRHRIILTTLERISSSIGLLLDIGSGQGDFLQKVSTHRLARELVGFELSKTGVNIAKDKVPEGNFFQVDMFNPPEEINKYFNSSDVVVCSDVIEHVDDPQEFLLRVRSFLKIGGYLLVTVPGGPMSAFDHHIGHRIHYDKLKIRQVLEEAGFSVVKIQLAGFPFFNLYRLAIILRGKKLISDVSTEPGEDKPNTVALFVMSIFGMLFKFNLSDFPLGWQVFAIARRIN